jgi:hypothetical protein
VVKWRIAPTCNCVHTSRIETRGSFPTTGHCATTPQNYDLNGGSEAKGEVPLAVRFPFRPRRHKGSAKRRSLWRPRGLCRMLLQHHVSKPVAPSHVVQVSRPYLQPPFHFSRSTADKPGRLQVHRRLHVSTLQSYVVRVRPSGREHLTFRPRYSPFTPRALLEDEMSSLFGFFIDQPRTYLRMGSCSASNRTSKRTTPKLTPTSGPSRVHRSIRSRRTFTVCLT